MSRRVARKLRGIAWEYGKTGLLIDDSPECETRVARALYGSDSLPPWWILVRSIDCACNALNELHAICSDPSFRSLRGLVLVDRYLPLNCDQAGTVPWHGSEQVPSEPVQLMRERVDRIVKLAEPSIKKGLALGEKPAFLIRFLTSFPVLGEQNPHLTIPGQSFSKISWQTRSTELLQHERRQCQESDDWRCLLQFGPQTSARVKQDTPPTDLIDARTAAAAKWRAETWEENLQHLARMFKDRRRMILITGAGSSIRCSPTSPGMLPTDQIVRRICREIRDGDAGKGRIADTGARFQEPACACRFEPVVAAGDAEPRDIAPPGIALSPIRQLIEQVSANPEGWLNFKLEEACDRKKHKGSLVEFEQFHRLFRRELYRRDFGFAYHHWLMARFRWTAIITTNFDGFHERAAASVARMLPQGDEARLWALSLGSVAHDWRDRPDRDSPKRWEKRGALGEHRLFKPYGSLYSPSGELLLSTDEIDAFQSEFRIALETALRLEESSRTASPGAIVVVGHSMRDELVGNVLKEKNLLRSLEGFEFVWVDPAAYDRCERPQTLWEQWLSRKKTERTLRAEGDKALYGGAEHYNECECSGPVPARALDFIFDLQSHLRLQDEL